MTDRMGKQSGWKNLGGVRSQEGGSQQQSQIQLSFGNSGQDSANANGWGMSLGKEMDAVVK